MTLKFFATYRDITRCKEIRIPAPADVWALLIDLGARYGAPMRDKLFTPDGMGVGEEAILLVNGRNIMDLEGKDTSLSDGDVVCLFPMVAGG